MYIYCIGKRSPGKYTIIYLDEYKNEYSILFRNSGNSKTSDTHRLRLNLSDEIDLQRGDTKCVTLSNFSIYCIGKNIKSLKENINLKYPGTTWHEEFKLPDGSYSISGIQNCFEYMIKKHQLITHYQKLCKNNSDKSGYYLELLAPETMELLGSIEEKISKRKNGENV